MVGLPQRARRIWLIPVLLVGAACTAPGAPGVLRPRTEIEVERDPGADLSRLRTYRWMPGPPLAVDDARIDAPLLEKRIREAIAAALEARGYERKLAGTVDFFIAYHVSLSEKLKVSSASTSYAGRSSEWPSALDPSPGSAVMTTYEAGTLVIDLVDPATSRVLWRGSGQTRVDPTRDSEATKIERINRGAELILARLSPPRPAASAPPEP
jgi:hypothetical protein